MITIKKPEEIEILKECGKRLSGIMKEIVKAVSPGVSTKELNDLANKLAKEGGDVPSFLNYSPDGASRRYPASLCVSINDEVVHGIPNEDPKILKNGDIVSLDMGLTHKGFITDMAVTVPVGQIDEKAEKLIEITKKALHIGIKSARGGKRVGDIGYAIENFVIPFNYGIVEDLAGHGVGYKVHEDPYVPNVGNKDEGPKLKPGMVIAIEPMLNEGTPMIILDKDGYTFKTADGKRSAHFEHTIVITEKEPIILTV